MPPTTRKRNRENISHRRHHPSTATTAAGGISHISSTAAVLIDRYDTDTLYRTSSRLHRTSSASSISAPNTTRTPTPLRFNDSTTADVVLRLYVDQSFPFDPSSAPTPPDSPIDETDLQVFLHSAKIRRADYFAMLLSGRWQHRNHNGSSDICSDGDDDIDDAEADGDDDSNRQLHVNFPVQPSPNAISTHLAVLQLLYTNDFANAIDSVSTALDILPVALRLLFEDCVKSCVRFLEAVPWNEDEEKRVLNLVPFLREEESEELLARVSAATDDSCEEMLHELISAAIHNYPNVAYVKAFVAKLLRDSSSREAAGRALERVFASCLKIMKESLEEYSSPDFRGDHNETEAIQKMNLHTAMTNGKHLVWLAERMVELRVADSAVKEWSGQPGFAVNLLRALRDGVWRTFMPAFPVVVSRCTSKLANAVAAGTVIAPRQVTEAKAGCSF